MIDKCCTCVNKWGGEKSFCTIMSNVTLNFFLNKPMTCTCYPSPMSLQFNAYEP